MDDNNAMVPYEPNARLNVTYGGQNGDYPDPVDFNNADGDVKQVATEAIRTGYIPGIPADPAADLTDFVVERYPATEELPPRLMLRPKTPFGMNVREKIEGYLNGLGCKVWEGAPGIWYVKTPHDVIWDMTIPQQQEDKP
jgi:hypothetical protein